MIKSYFKTSRRNLSKNKGYSIVNIGGLALGMSVAMLIGLWVHDELTFNNYFKNHRSLVMITKDSNFEGRHYAGNKYLPYPLINELKTNYAANFTNVIPFTSQWQGVLSTPEKSLLKTGMYIDESAPESFTFEMVYGNWKAMSDPHTTIISESTAIALFGDQDPIDRTVKINNGTEVKITGVYKDFPHNTAMYGIQFFEPWDFFENDAPWVKQGWDNHLISIYAELAPNVSLEQAAENIREAEVKAIRGLDYMQEQLKGNPEIKMIPMEDWHLRSTFREGKYQNGPVQLVWFIGAIGIFVLLLACINFMNLSTARSERRAKEVGVRKTMGSARAQLIAQFFTESFVIVGCAFVCTILIVSLVLPAFNQISGKLMTMPWKNFWFWISSAAFLISTGLLAGSYPAFYLSSFKPVRVLKGTFRVGRLASLPRKILVVTQFTVSVTLIISTVAIYDQLTFVKNRPVGYNRDGLVMIRKRSDAHFEKSQTIINELKASGAVSDVAESGGSPTAPWAYNGGFTWKGSKPSEQTDGFYTLDVSPLFGKTVGWQFIEGRDFNEHMASDSLAMVLNEAAVKAMGLKDPVGKTIHSTNRFVSAGSDFTIVGVIKDMVMTSPFEPVTPTMYFTSGFKKYLIMRIDPSLTAGEALPRIGDVFGRIVPDMPFDYQFVDQEYAAKFDAEERVSQLAAIFTALAIIISCLGLSGLASFVAETRTKEIGIRKVLGASVSNLWALLSKEFVLLVMAACLVAAPLSYYILSAGLENYNYKTGIGWWIFVAACAGALVVTLITISFQSIRSALMNPVKSLRWE
jgi:putative ABC transport system permease protein